MSKRAAYDRSLELLKVLGLPKQSLNLKWVGSSTKEWLDKVDLLESKTQSTEDNLNEIRRLRDTLSIRVKIPAKPTRKNTARTLYRLKTRIRKMNEPKALSPGNIRLKTKSELYKMLKGISGTDRPIPWMGTTKAQLITAIEASRAKSRPPIDSDLFVLIESKEEKEPQPLVVSKREFSDGANVITYTHEFEYPEPLDSGTAPFLKRAMINALRNVDTRHSGRVGIMGEIGGIKRPMSTPFIKGKSMTEIINILFKLTVDKMAREYRNGYEVNSFYGATHSGNSSAMGKSARTITQAYAKWVKVVPKSDINCVFQSVAAAKNFRGNRQLLEVEEDGSDAQEARVNSGKELKRAMRDKGFKISEGFSNNETLQMIADYTRCYIRLFDNIYEHVNTFAPATPKKRYRSGKFIDLQRVANHCNALIPRAHIEKAFPEFHVPTLGENKKAREPTKEEPIKKRKYYHKYNHKIAAWDIEASPDPITKEFVPYMCSIAWNEYKWSEPEPRTITSWDMKEKQFSGLDCLQRMVSWIYQEKDTFNGYTLYAHNGGKFDLPLAIENAFMTSDDFMIDGKGCLELNNSWIGFKLVSKTDRKHTLTFRDSCRLLPASLDKLTKELKVEHQKLTETVCHDAITIKNYKSFPELSKYLTHDVFGLLEVLMIFGRGVYDAMGIDITRCYTGASLSKTNYFKNYYKPEFMPVYTLNDEHDRYIRDSYYGGRVEAFQMGKIEKAYYYDFTSLYPDLGRRDMPYGKPQDVRFVEDMGLPDTLNNTIYEYIEDESIIIGNKKLPADFFGWVKCRVRTTNQEAILANKALPKHAVLHDQRLTFPIIDEWKEMTLFSEEIDYEAYEYEFLDGVKFQRGKLLKRFFEDGFAKKATSKAEGNLAMAQAYKIIINSGYGFWGLRTKDRDGVIIAPSKGSPYLPFLNDNKLLGMREVGDQMFMRVMKDLEVKDFNVAIAAAISSYSRLKLHSLLSAIRSAGGHIYYCDTDSVICSINLDDYPDIKDKFQWDGTGEELGSLKNEADEKVQKLLKKLYDQTKQKSILKDLIDAENGNLAWDEGYITGCKSYALTKKITIEGREHTITICKLKGYSQKDTHKLKSGQWEKQNNALQYDQMRQMAEGEVLSQRQYQFRCPKSNYVSETHQFKIRKQDVVKSFRKCYTKGIEQPCGNVQPLRI